MDETSIVEVVKELQVDLARKYRIHSSAVESAWRSFDKNQRTRCLTAGAADGVVLKHPLDVSLGNVYKLMPEWNLRDITEPGSDFLLDLLKHRATKSVFEQYCAGPNGRPGDHALIDEMMRVRGLRHVQPFKDCYTFFTDEETYGRSVKIQSHHTDTLAGFGPAIRARLCVPQATGELILQRQVTLLQCLNIIIEDILEEGSRSRDRKQRPKKSDKAAVDALAALSLQAPPTKATKLALPDVVASARDQKAALEEYLDLLSTEPVVLAHAVNVWFFSRPELIADEKGRILPIHTDKYISAAFFETVHNAVKGAAIWNYISRLLDLLESSATDKSYRAIVLQETSNICHLEYGRAQALFKRHVQTGMGSKRFKRVSNAYDNAGNARVSMKGNPADLTVADPQLHYMLRLCQAETTASKAVDWVKKLSDLHEAHPTEREKLGEREADALGDLAVIIEFIQDLSPVISMPSLSRKKGQMFVSRSHELEVELGQVKNDIDLRDLVVPIDNLLEPGIAERALEKLDHFVIEKTGTKMGFLYQDLVEDCLSDLRNQYDRVKAKLEQADKTEWSPLPVTTSEPPEKRVEQRRQKEKTRPSHSSAYEITPHEGTPAAEESASSQLSQTFKVGPSTAEVFSTLFARPQSRGSVSWAAYVAAMAELGFSVLPKFGSVYTFFPPESMAVKKSLTVHRPHTSRIEGYLVLIFARRLKRVYGWGEGTFETA